LGQFAVEALEGFVGLRHVGLEVYGFDGISGLKFFPDRSAKLF
jgi:hypothetical protein